MKGARFGLLGDIILGMLGAVVGGLTFGFLGISGGLIGSIVSATVGAAFLLFIVGQVKQS